VREAKALAAATPAAIRHVVESIQEEQRIPVDERIEFRALGPAEAAPVADAKGAKIALVLFLASFGFFVFVILGIPRFLAAWRSAEPDSALLEPEESDGLEESPTVLPGPNAQPGTGTGVASDPAALRARHLTSRKRQFD
jgi:hypothetical protein